MAISTDGGNATVFVRNMDEAIHFYTEILGLKLGSRYGDHWATLEAGKFTIGLHPASEKQPKPGTKGSITIGLNINESIDGAAQRLRANNVRLSGEVTRAEAGNFLGFEDPSGNELYLWESPKQEKA